MQLAVGSGQFLHPQENISGRLGKHLPPLQKREQNDIGLFFVALNVQQIRIRGRFAHCTLQEVVIVPSTSLHLPSLPFLLPSQWNWLRTSVDGCSMLLPLFGDLSANFLLHQYALTPSHAPGESSLGRKKCEFYSKQFPVLPVFHPIKIGLLS